MHREAHADADVEHEDLLVGRILDGRYQLIRRLGRGGMGAVYEAEHIKLETKVAIKVLQASLSSNEKYRKRFLREARAASAIESEHIVRSSDFGSTSDGLLYFAMELMEGEDLEQYLQRCSRIDWPQFEPLVFQLTDALKAAHKRGVIHRDIKPSNCFLCATELWPPLVKVLDFGIAKINASVADGESPVATLETLTATNELFGTIAYMAPELIEGHAADARSDIYALGILIFRALTGQLPFTSPNVYKLLQQHVSKPVPSMRVLVPEIPAAVESVVFRAMAKLPEHRYQSIAELEAALKAASEGVIEPSSAALSGYTQAVRRGHSDAERPRFEDALASGDVTAIATLPNAPPVTERIEDPGSLASARIRAPRFSPLAMIGIALVVAGGTAVAMHSFMDGSGSASSSTSLPAEASAAPPTRAPTDTIEASATTMTKDVEQPGTVSEPRTEQPPVETSAAENTAKSSRRASSTSVPSRKERTKKPATSERSIHELAGLQCPAAIGGHFTIEGLLGGDGKYISTEVTGEPKAARPCIEAFVRTRSFGKGRSMKTHTEQLSPR